MRLRAVACVPAVVSLGANAFQAPFRVPRPSSGAAIAIPTRPLQWGDINVLSTTDTHGWLLGHQKESFPEPNYSGTWGDYASFCSTVGQEKDVDLLLVDSGDMHDGTGLSDGFPEGGVDAQDTGEFFKQIPYDVLAIGNHELYKYANAFDMHMHQEICGWRIGADQSSPAIPASPGGRSIWPCIIWCSPPTLKLARTYQIHTRRVYS
ncbi:hypothetical protein MKEN_00152700 [Mycena kentingensis (nom. inval.)]|nr:hypothetical protein MKEN_00152700 [Mycena kentingensis (nom. inval.)]